MAGRIQHTFALVVVAGLSVPSAAAGLIAAHSGSADPTTQGWTALPGSGGVLVGGVNDSGTEAWFVDDNSTVLNSIYLYEHAVLAGEISDGNTSGWELSTSLRVASDEVLTVDGSPVVSYRDGVRGWQMNFGLNSGGDTFVRLFDGATHTLVGNSSYNTFALRYDPVASNADLFVNGVEVISDYAGFANTQTRVLWGAGRSPDAGQGNFASVAFATVPEPTSLPVLTGFLLAVFLEPGRRARRA